MKPLLCFALLVGIAADTQADDFLREGDRIALVGATLIEREQRYGYWETALTLLHPHHNLTFRNLGWSGDTVFGEARAGFGSASDGYRKLLEIVLGQKPTVILLCYGGNEAFAGSKGLEPFLKQYGVLLDALAPAKARFLIALPPFLRAAGEKLPQPTTINHHLVEYRRGIARLAEERNIPIIDPVILPELDDLTDNGMHLTALGYWATQQRIAVGFTSRRPDLAIRIENGKDAGTSGGKVEPGEGTTFRVTAATLPFPPAPLPTDQAARTAATRTLLVKGLAKGTYDIRIDGESVAVATAEELAAGIVIRSGPEFKQVEELRQTILAKNELFFHRWRPQNETYLFGFRKHEQGKNAAEVPLFDPLVVEQEKRIAELRVPKTRTYSLTLKN